MKEIILKPGSRCLLQRLLCISTALMSMTSVAAKNPVFEGWYADPEVAVYGDRVWIYPTRSDLFERQTSMDAFSSADLKHWTRHEAIIDTTSVKWAWGAMWAPSTIEKGGKYYLFFGANDVHEGEIGGIGVAVSDTPAGPFKDLLGHPLIGEIVNGAQPIDQYVTKGVDGEYYMYYGGWRHCNVVKLKEDFTGLKPFNDGEIYKEVTPENYVEGPIILPIAGKYYFMWSEGEWGNSTYKVAYAISDSPLGPFERIDTILEEDDEIARGAGHHSILRLRNGKPLAITAECSGELTDDYYIVYHRRPIDTEARDHRETCIDRIYLRPDGRFYPVKMTK